jgi:UDP-N-acetylmuramoylalanine--D-glutamate ligase
MAAVRFLHALGVKVSVSESRPKEQLGGPDLEKLARLGVRMETGGHSREFFAPADFVVPSPGVPLDLPALRYMREKKVPVLGELALAAGRIPVPVIGVTGSNGKTTVTSLIGHLLDRAGKKVFVGGNIGTPILDYLMGEQQEEIMVLELSSFQLEIAGGFRPDIALLLNLSPDHLDRHGSMEKYAAAKFQIFACQQPADTAILCADDPLVMRGPTGGAGTVLRFGFHPDAEAHVTENGVTVSATPAEEYIHEHYPLTGTPLLSYVNRLNAAAAVLAARTAGCPPEAVRSGLADFMPPDHRMTFVGEIDGVSYIDDSKATNVGAVIAALKSCGSQVVLIAGGRDKDSDFSLLRPAVREHVKQLILIGEAADMLSETLGFLVPTGRAATMEDAVRLAAEIAQPGNTVLLAPGCASFDMFTGFAHRGEVFRQAVLGLGKIRVS